VTRGPTVVATWCGPSPWRFATSAAVISASPWRPMITTSSPTHASGSTPIGARARAGRPHRPALARAHAIDRTEVPDACVGDEVVIIGRQGDAEITAAEVAKRHGLGPHHVATTVGPRVTRVYLSGGVPAKTD